MFGLFLLLFVVAPTVELYVALRVAHSIGAPETILLLIAVSMVGVGLAKRQGMAVVRRMQATVAAGKVPSAEIVDGVLMIFAGLLMVAPGFVSDALAILLLLPPTRAVVRRSLLRRIRAGGGFVTAVVNAPGRRATFDPLDVDSWEDPPGTSGGPPELAP